MTLPTTLNFSVLTAVLASFGVLAAGWNQVKSFLQRIVDLFIVRVAVKDDLSIAMQSFVWSRGKRSPFGLKIFGGAKNYVHPNKRIEVIGYETISSDPMLIWFNNRPAIICRQSYNNIGKNDNFGAVKDSGDGGVLRIYFLRGSFNLDNFFNEVIANYNNIHHQENLDKSNKPIKNRFQIVHIKNFDKSNTIESGNTGFPFSGPQVDILTLLKTNSARLLQWNKSDLIENIDKSPFDDYPFPENVIDILKEIKLWKENGNFFKEKGVPWRRGYILEGLPGSGKSTLIRSIGKEFDMPIYVFDLARETNISFPENFQKAQASSPAIVLIEDIDSVFEKRVNLSKGQNPKDSLTFDCLLNTISGVGNSDGVLLFITTNNIDKLDSALGVSVDGKSSRPGRIDKIITLGLMAETERRKLAALILDNWPEKIDNVVKDGEGETAAQFQDRCAQLALNLFWAQNLK